MRALCPPRLSRKKQSAAKEVAAIATAEKYLRRPILSDSIRDSRTPASVARGKPNKNTSTLMLDQQGRATSGDHSL
jgi:hypothetical protein